MSSTLLFLILINSIATEVTNEQKTFVTITDPNTPNELIKTFAQEIKITLKEEHLDIEKDDNGDIIMNISTRKRMYITMEISIDFSK